MNNDVLRMCCLSNLTKFKIDRTRLRYCYNLLDYESYVWCRRHCYTNFFFKGKGREECEESGEKKESVNVFVP